MGKISGFEICGQALPVEQANGNPYIQMFSLQGGYLKSKYCSRDLPQLKAKFEEMTSLRSKFELQNSNYA